MALLCRPKRLTGVTAAQLAQTTFVAGTSGVSDDLLVIASDGKAYSNGGNYSEFHVNVAANHPPVLTATSPNISMTEGHSIAATNLFSATDLDGDTLSFYLYDSNTSPNSGHFVVNGTTIPDGTNYMVTAAQLAQTSFVAGTAGTTDNIVLTAFDGTAFSNHPILNITATPNHAPVLTVPSTNVAATQGQSIAASSLFSATDADGDSLTYYLLDNTSAANSGHFVVDGIVQSAGAVHMLTAAQVAQTTFVAGAQGSNDDLFVIAYDGKALSGHDYTEFHVFV